MDIPNANTYFFGHPTSKSKINSNKFNNNHGAGKSKIEIESSKKICMEPMPKSTQVVPFYQKREKNIYSCACWIKHYYIEIKFWEILIIFGLLLLYASWNWALCRKRFYGKCALQ